MTDQKGGGAGSFFAFVVGAAAGAAAAWLMSPRAGRENRRRLKRWLDGALEDAQETGHGLIKEAESLWKDKEGK